MSSDLEESEELSSEERGFRTYSGNPRDEETFLWMTQSTWNRVYFFGFLMLLGVFGMTVWLMWDIKNNVVTDVEVINGNVKRDEIEDFSEEDERAVSNGGIVMKRKGNTLQVITSNIGLSAQKIGSKVFATNSGTISITGSTGMNVVSSAAARDIDERATLYTGTSYTLKATGVQTVKSTAVAKREDEERGVVVSTGIDVITTDQEVNILNTGVLSTTASTGLVNTGTSQDVVLKVSNPVSIVTVTIAYTDLASSGTKTILAASSGTATYKILEIVTVSTGSVNFTGGNRVIDIGTASVQKWFISANAAATTGTTSLTTGTTNAAIQPSTAVNALSDTAAGANIVAKYSGGSSDYTAGTVSATFVIMQTAY